VRRTRPSTAARLLAATLAAGALPWVAMPGTAAASGGAAWSTRVNVGGPAVTDGLGQRWAADSGYDGGRAVRVSGQTGEAAAVTRDGRQGMRAYALAVPAAGAYRVRLWCSAPAGAVAAPRLVSVRSDAATLVSNLDVARVAPAGRLVLVDRVVRVSGRQLRLRFAGGSGTPVLGAIEVAAARPAAAPLPVPPTATVAPSQAPGDLSLGALGLFGLRLADDAPLLSGPADGGPRLARQAAYGPTSSPKGWYAEGYQSIFQVGRYSVPIYTVAADAPRVPVRWVDPGTGAVRPDAWACGLNAALAAVPLPARTDGRALQADGTDGHLAVYQPATDTLWEFWDFADRGPAASPRFTAGYGGRIDHVHTAPATLPCQWGARATSLALTAGVVTMQDYLSGSINHALAVGVPVADAAVVGPATRTDGPSAAVPGNDARDAVSEGSRYRLPAGYDCAAHLPAGAPRLLQLVCGAARDYGLVVVDKTGGSVTLQAEDDRTVGTPYQSVQTSPWAGIGDQFGGPKGVLNAFPWRDLRQVAA